MNTRMKTEMMFVRSTKPHYHEAELEIILVLKGEINVHKIERKITLKEGQFTFVNRRIVHYITSSGAYILSTKIRLDQFRECFERIEYVEFMSIDEQTELNRPLKQRHNAIVIDSLIKDYLLRDLPSQAQEKIFNEKQLVSFLFISYQLTSNVKKDDEYLNHEMTARYYQIVEYISKHIHEKITTEDILQEVYMNSTYFSQFMKKVGGVGFKEFISYRKIILINILLLNESYTLTEIADLVDISDMKTFYLNFRKYFKTSPAKWREALMRIEDDWQTIENRSILDDFIIRYHINRHRENSMSKYYRFVSKCRENGISLKDTEIMINPYEERLERSDKDYQAYKYSGALFNLIKVMDAKLVLAYPVKALDDADEEELTIQSLKYFSITHGINEMKKWRILFQAGNAHELEYARRLEQRIYQEVGGLNIKIVMALADV